MSRFGGKKSCGVETLIPISSLSSREIHTYLLTLIPLFSSINNKGIRERLNSLQVLKGADRNKGFNSTIFPIKRNVFSFVNIFPVVERNAGIEPALKIGFFNQDLKSCVLPLHQFRLCAQATGLEPVLRGWKPRYSPGDYCAKPLH